MHRSISVIGIHQSRAALLLTTKTPGHTVANLFETRPWIAIAKKIIDPWHVHSGGGDSLKQIFELSRNYEESHARYERQVPRFESKNHEQELTPSAGYPRFFLGGNYLDLVFNPFRRIPSFFGKTYLDLVWGVFFSSERVNARLRRRCPKKRHRSAALG